MWRLKDWIARRGWLSTERGEDIWLPWQVVRPKRPCRWQGPGLTACSARAAGRRAGYPLERPAAAQGLTLRRVAPPPEEVDDAAVLEVGGACKALQSVDFFRSFEDPSSSGRSRLTALSDIYAMGVSPGILRRAVVPRSVRQGRDCLLHMLSCVHHLGGGGLRAERGHSAQGTMSWVCCHGDGGGAVRRRQPWCGAADPDSWALASF